MNLNCPKTEGGHLEVPKPLAANPPSSSDIIPTYKKKTAVKIQVIFCYCRFP
jgi:hypothetical protein